MVFPIYIGLAWLAAGLTVTAGGNRFPRKELAFLFLFFTLVNCHVQTLFDDALHWFTISSDPKKFAAFLLFRTLIVPAVLTLAMLPGSRKIRLTVIAAALLALTLADSHLEASKVINAGSWTPLHAFAYYGLLLLSGSVSFIGFRRLKERP